MRFAPIERALEDIAAGRPVVVVDDEDRENEGDLIFAAQHATTELLDFTIRHTSGYVCAPLTAADCDRLHRASGSKLLRSSGKLAMCFIVKPGKTLPGETGYRSAILWSKYRA